MQKQSSKQTALVHLECFPPGNPDGAMGLKEEMNGGPNKQETKLFVAEKWPVWDPLSTQKSPRKCLCGSLFCAPFPGKQGTKSCVENVYVLFLSPRIAIAETDLWEFWQRFADADSLWNPNSLPLQIETSGARGVNSVIVRLQGYPWLRGAGCLVLPEKLGFFCWGGTGWGGNRGSVTAGCPSAHDRQTPYRQRDATPLVLLKEDKSCATFA